MLHLIQNILYSIPQLERITNKQIIDSHESFEIKKFKKEDKLTINNNLFIFISGACTDILGNKINKLQIVNKKSKLLNFEEDSEILICNINILKKYISNIYIEKIFKGEII